MKIAIATIDDVRKAISVVRKYVAPVPMYRSYALEKELGLEPSRHVWLKDYGWTPSGAFKVYGALNWLHCNRERIGHRVVTAHSSGNFAAGLAFACLQSNQRVIIVMPDNAPKVKFELTRSFGADIRTYDIAQDHESGARDRLVKEIADAEEAVSASPYDDNAVIAGNGVGGIEIVDMLQSLDRSLSHFLCPVSGGGLMAGHALAIADRFPTALQIAVEPEGADDFSRSMVAGQRTSIHRPQSICDGLLSYDVGEHNWPILRRHVAACSVISDAMTTQAMRWLYDHHGLVVEPSGAITVAALLSRTIDLTGQGDIVAVISGRNVDEDRFRNLIPTT
jgi:threo-3-hydroxy-L-aspartate ammonia-lyase